MIRIIGIVLLVLAGGFTVRLWLLGRESQSMSPALGQSGGTLKPCPKSPNCVHSQADPEDEKHFIRPFEYSGEMKAAREKLEEIIRGMKNTEIVESQAQYLHAEFTVSIFRFVDDFELYFPPEEKVVHVRSASRVGYSDLGANRKRVERIRAAFSGK